ncbi:MAG: hypothetical protein QM704_00650 [Anaeromyxobacteraceae bacterium]
MTDPNTPSAPPPPLIPVGAHVTSRHAPEWGKGVVMSRDGKLVRVLFFAHPAKKPVAVPATSLVVGHVASWPDPSKYTGPTGGTAVKAKSKAKAKPKAAKVAKRSREEGLAFFKNLFPAGFTDPRYLKEERDYKWAAHEQFEQTLGKAELARLIDAGDAAELAKRALAVETVSQNLLHPIEKARLKDAFADAEKTLGYFRALKELLEADAPEGAFAGFVKAVEALPSKKGKAANWTLTTIIPFLARPDTFLFVKPSATQESAARYSFDLMYKPTPSVETFVQLKELVKLLRADLDPLGCRDLIDVYSYIYRSASED